MAMSGSGSDSSWLTGRPVRQIGGDPANLQAAGSALRSPKQGLVNGSGSMRVQAKDMRSGAPLTRRLFRSASSEPEA